MKRFRLALALFISIFFISQALAAEWIWSSSPTPGSFNLFNEEDSEQNFENGTLSNDILLSEIMPNPEGTDTDTEWIELYNSGIANIDLGNWSLDDEDGGSDPFVFPAGTIIEAQDFLVIYRINSDLALNNDTDSVRLFDFEQNLKDNVIYENNAPEGESYARILTEENDSLLSYLIPATHAKTLPEFKQAPWEWTKDLTLGTSNPVYYFISGVVKEIIPFENKIILSLKNDQIQVDLSGLELNDALKTSLFSPGNPVSGYASLSNNIYKLQKFNKTTPDLKNTSQSHINKFTTLSLCGLLLGTIVFITKKFFPKLRKELPVN